MTPGDRSGRDLTGGGPETNGGNRAKARKLTPRQAQILDLAAGGLSDKEIARRLGVSHRTIRTHLEKLFHDRGFRSRSQAVAMWSARPTHTTHHPADECPYPKPFPPGFVECPAFQPSQMVALDISHHPLGSILTCRHLESRLMPNTDYRWYGACIVGDAEARRRWSKSVGETRLHDISELRQEVSALSTPYVQKLWELKSISVEESPTVARQIQGTVDEFITRMTALLRERRLVLDELHLPLDACIRLLRIAIDRFVEQGLSEAEWEVPEEVLALFPEDVQSYFRPRQSTSAPVAQGQGPGTNGPA